MEELKHIIDPKYHNIFPYDKLNKLQQTVLYDAVQTDNSIVVSAPTASGKTVVLEMAIVRLLMNMEKMRSPKEFKIVYMAPVKALCAERFKDWQDKFSPHNITCIQVTGDSENLELSMLQNYNIIITTPEKWDALTRKWYDSRTILDTIKLFMIDEVHLLKDKNRGPILEAVVSRMKTIQKFISESNNSTIDECSIDRAFKIDDLFSTNTATSIFKNMSDTIRFIAISATFPNADDIAKWLDADSKPCICHKLGEEYRPVPLKKIVEGIKSGDDLFKFDINLNYRIPSLIENHSNNLPVLIFCSSRRSVEVTAKTLSGRTIYNFSFDQKVFLYSVASKLHDSTLKTLVENGIGCHHAGYLPEDRQLIEETFRNSDLPILITTSTLAMGVNLPAHLVVIKTTYHYVNGQCQEYDESTILQMMGRAGRPQFAKEGVVVILTTFHNKKKYENLCNGSLPIESNLHHNLTEHLNAEIALKTISDASLVMNWIKSTFLYVRAVKNPNRYFAIKESTGVDEKLNEICLESLSKMASVGLIEICDNGPIKSTETGILMASHCLNFETTKLLLDLKGTESLYELIQMISECHEFIDIPLRRSDKKFLNELNGSKNNSICRYQIPGNITSRQMKINCLIQTYLDGFKVSDSSLFQDLQKISRSAEHICIVFYITRNSYLFDSKPKYKLLLNAIILQKCFVAKMWENSKHVARQFHGIGKVYSQYLFDAGKTTFKLIKESNPRDLETILNKQPPFGNTLVNWASMLPVYCVSATINNSRTLEVTLSIRNRHTLKNGKLTTGSDHKCSLIIGDSSNNLLLFETYMDTHLISNNEIKKKIIPKNTGEHKIFINFISHNWVGLDVSSTVDVRKSQNNLISRNIKKIIRCDNDKMVYTKNKIPLSQPTVVINDFMHKSMTNDHKFNEESCENLIQEYISESVNKNVFQNTSNSVFDEKNENNPKEKGVLENNDGLAIIDFVGNFANFFDSEEFNEIENEEDENINEVESSSETENVKLISNVNVSDNNVVSLNILQSENLLENNDDAVISDFVQKPVTYIQNTDLNEMTENNGESKKLEPAKNTSIDKENINNDNCLPNIPTILINSETANQNLNEMTENNCETEKLGELEPTYNTSIDKENIYNDSCLPNIPSILINSETTNGNVSHDSSEKRKIDNRSRDTENECNSLVSDELNENNCKGKHHSSENDYFQHNNDFLLPLKKRYRKNYNSLVNNEEKTLESLVEVLNKDSISVNNNNGRISPIVEINHKRPVTDKNSESLKNPELMNKDNDTSVIPPNSETENNIEHNIPMKLIQNECIDNADRSTNNNMLCTEDTNKEINSILKKYAGNYKKISSANNSDFTTPTQPINITTQNILHLHSQLSNNDLSPNCKLRVNPLALKSYSDFNNNNFDKLSTPCNELEFQKPSVSQKKKNSSFGNTKLYFSDTSSQCRKKSRKLSNPTQSPMESDSLSSNFSDSVSQRKKFNSQVPSTPTQLPKNVAEKLFTPSQLPMEILVPNNFSNSTSQWKKFNSQVPSTPTQLPKNVAEKLFTPTQLPMESLVPNNFSNSTSQWKKFNSQVPSTPTQLPKNVAEKGERVSSFANNNIHFRHAQLPRRDNNLNNLSNQQSLFYHQRQDAQFIEQGPSLPSFVSFNNSNGSLSQQNPFSLQGQNIQYLSQDGSIPPPFVNINFSNNLLNQQYPFRLHQGNSVRSLTNNNLNNNQQLPQNQYFEYGQNNLAASRNQSSHNTVFINPVRFMKNFENSPKKKFNHNS